MRPHYLLYTYLPLIPASFLFSIKLCERLSNLIILVFKQMKVLQMNRISPFSLSLCIHFLPSLGKVSKQFLYKFILIFSVIWLGMIRLKYRSFKTDMGIQMMQRESQQKNRNFDFAIHVTYIIPIYAFRAIPLT